MASQVLPARSSKVKVNVQFPVKVYPVAFNPVIVSLNQVTMTSTFPLVRLHEAGVYSTLAVGETRSGRLISKVAPVLFPTASVSIKVYVHDDAI